MSFPWLTNIYERATDPVLSHGYDSMETLRRSLNHPSFRDFARHAYSVESGYAIRRSPITGKIEMFVAGTRSRGQWALNIFDAALYNYTDPVFHVLDPWRVAKQRELTNAVLSYGVQVVYGHSRGGALVADLKLPDIVQKVGLDAAMVLAKNKSMLNLNEGGGFNPMGKFDEMIGRTGLKNVTVDYSPFSPHKVWSA